MNHTWQGQEIGLAPFVAAPKPEDAWVIQFAVPFFRHCQIVLVMPCADGTGWAPYRDAGMRPVGAHPDRAVVDRCWQRQEPVFCTTPARLAAYPERFDAAAVSFAALGLRDDEIEAAVAGLAAALCDGGRLVIEACAAQLGRIEAALGASFLGAQGESFRPFGTDDDRCLAARRIARQAGGDVIAVNGPAVAAYADPLTGRGPVLELGAGSGRMLDALRLRDLECAGFDPDADMVAAGRARGHRMLSIEELRNSDPWGAVFVGHAVDALTSPQRAALMGCCRRLVAPGGRLVASIPADHREDFVAAAQRAGWERATFDWGSEEGGRCRLHARAPNAEALPASMDVLQTLTGRGLAIGAPPRSVFDLERFERRIHSQGGEDGLLEALFAHIGTTNRHYVELGGGDGVQCNTAALREKGWRGLIVDGAEKPADASIPLVNAWISVDSVNRLLDAYEVPAEPDLLSLDIDGNDYWVWQAIDRRPRVVIAEYNGNLPARRALTVPYDPHRTWNGSDHYGASLAALVRLGRAKGYTLCYCTQAGVNAVFVRDDLVDAAAPSPLAIYRPANYWYRGGRQLPDLEAPWVEFDPLPDDGTHYRRCAPPC